jgi:hypothetical protein
MVKSLGTISHAFDALETGWNPHWDKNSVFDHAINYVMRERLWDPWAYETVHWERRIFHIKVSHLRNPPLRVSLAAKSPPPISFSGVFTCGGQLVCTNTACHMQVVLCIHRYRINQHAATDKSRCLFLVARQLTSGPEKKRALHHLHACIFIFNKRLKCEKERKYERNST